MEVGASDFLRQPLMTVDQVVQLASLDVLKNDDTTALRRLTLRTIASLGPQVQIPKNVWMAKAAGYFELLSGELFSAGVVLLQGKRSATQ